VSVVAGLASSGGMVKKAVAYIKTERADKAYAEIDNPFGQFVERELYIVVYRQMENWRMSRSGASLRSSSQDFWQS
jgi:hypothetical protein